jgi:hypothetical protein
MTLIKNRAFPGNDLSGQYIQVVVSIRDGEDKHEFTIDPWDNCPSEMIREEGRYCNDCEYWGRHVEGIDWSEFSLCLWLNE